MSRSWPRIRSEIKEIASVEESRTARTWGKARNRGSIVLDGGFNAWDAFWRTITHARIGHDSRQETAPEGPKAGRRDKRQFLLTMDPEVINNIELAAIEDTSASEAMEEAAKQWLKRRAKAQKW